MASVNKKPFKVIQGEDRTMPFTAKYENGDPFALDNLTNIVFSFHGEGDTRKYKALNARAEKWLVEITGVSQNDEYAVSVDTETATIDSGATPTLSSIRTLLIDAINALTAAVTATAGENPEEIFVTADVAGTASIFEMSRETGPVSVKQFEAAVDAGGVSITSASAGKGEVTMSSSMTRELKVQDKQTFEAVVDKTTPERRILKFRDALTVEAREFS